MTGPHLRDDTDVAQDIARVLADIASQISSLKGEAKNCLGDPKYGAFRISGWITHTSRWRWP
jgi:hypothetical protein